jgi:hypothetical protein
LSRVNPTTYSKKVTAVIELMVAASSAINLFEKDMSHIVNNCIITIPHNPYSGQK